MEDSVVAEPPTLPPDLTRNATNSGEDFESLPIPPLDPQFFPSDTGMPSDSFMSDLGFGFGSEDNCDYELTFDDLDNLYLPSEADDFLIPDGFDPTAQPSGDSTLLLDSQSPESGLSKGSSDGVVSGFLNYPSSESGGHDQEFSENSGGPLSSQGSGIPEAGNSPTHSGNSDRDVSSSNVTTADEKVKIEEEMTRSGLVAKRKKESGGEEGNVESRSSKYRRSESGLNDEDEKRKARLMRNRESAQLSRQRKKHYVEELEDKVRAMHTTIADLNNKISYIMAENATLKQQLSCGSGMCPPPQPPPPGMYPMPPMGYPWMPYSPYVVKPQGSQVPLVPIPRLKPQQPAAAPKPKKKSESKTKKVASISFLGLLFFLLLFGGLVPMVNVGFGGSNYVRDRFYDQQRAKVLTVESHLNGSEGNIPLGISGGKFDVSNKIHERGHKQKEQGLPGVGNASEPLVASLYVPRNDKLVKIDGNLIIHSVLASEKAKTHKKSREARVEGAKDLVSALAIPEAGVNRGRRAPLYRTPAGQRKALTAGSADGKLQQWFREGLAGPLLSSGMCTEVFQFDVSAATHSGGIIPASSVANVSEHGSNSARLNRGGNRRILGGRAIPLAGSNHNVTDEERAIRNNQSSNNFQGSNSSMVVSVLVDPREAGDIDVDGMIKPKSLSRVFVVLLLDSVKYVTYSCVLPRSAPHLVTT
ncbi:putative transcription factor bZIP family [Rosa chinensis]|uniref:Putative transcription factor bZIP family n=1 Tax=Rosa chinensis TaxID=74649 RepID=A0A2P6R1C8_ROSCH|nr:bZIP transcription factor 17 [Rosa chinensis]PRQ40240.1 putative transcription factor bZIP family [Rosa chinensis]